MSFFFWCMFLLNKRSTTAAASAIFKQHKHFLNKAHQATQHTFHNCNKSRSASSSINCVEQTNMSQNVVAPASQHVHNTEYYKCLTHLYNHLSYYPVQVLQTGVVPSHEDDHFITSLQALQPEERQGMVN